MKALMIRRHGPLSEVYLGQTAKPRLAAGQVLVRTAAAALNHLDLWVVGGLPGIHLKMPHILGSDGAGTVEAVGAGVEAFRPGDRVMLNACLWCGHCEFCLQGEHSLCQDLRLIGEHEPGVIAEHFAAPERNLATVPDGVSFQQAAAFSLVFQTAWRMLITRARLRAGEDVFIHGVGGGVATACLQIARWAGARVFVSSGHDEKLERARKLGAEHLINYRRENIVAKTLELTEKRGVDVVVDNVGEQTWLSSLKMVRKGGRIVTCGATTGPKPSTEIRLIFWKQIDILGATMSNAAEYRTLIGLLGAGRLKPVIDQVFPFSRSLEALERLAQARQFGKIVLDFEA